MKSLKTITVTLLIAFGLTGCYTQLEYSQRMKKITDERPARGYAWNGESEESTEYYQDDEEGYSEYGYEDEGYIPVYYKDYETANWWSSCHCSPYSGYSYGSSYYYDDPWYYGYSSPWYGYHGRLYYSYHRPFYYSRWKWRHFGFGFHHSSFALSLHWGSPFYYHHYWDYPFYSYSGFLYGPYWAGYYYRPYWYGYGHYYGGRYYGHDGRSKDAIRSRSYRPRSIGTSRVRSDSRSNDRTRIDNRASTNKNTRIRSTGNTSVGRDRGTVRQNGARVQPPRTRDNSRVDVRNRSNSRSSERSRGTIQNRNQSNSSVSRSDRTRGTQRIDRNKSSRNSRVGVSETRFRNSRQVTPVSRERVRRDRSAIESRISRQRVSRPDENSSNNDRTSFFGRVKKFFNSGTPYNSSRYDGSRSRSTIKFNSPSSRRSHSRGSISRPRSSGKSTISRSSSSSSRSRGTTRSRGSSSSSRSRGN